MRPLTEFQRGYLCALSVIWHGHGSSSMINEALSALGGASIDPRAVDEYDRPMVREWLREKKAYNKRQKKACTLAITL
jgi:hypothetical protein